MYITIIFQGIIQQVEHFFGWNQITLNYVLNINVTLSDFIWNPIHIVMQLDFVSSKF